jgi:hypothetical protein
MDAVILSLATGTDAIANATVIAAADPAADRSGASLAALTAPAPPRVATVTVTR